MPKEFLDALFGELDGHRFTLWRLEDKSTFCFETPGEAAQWLSSLKACNDIYVAAGFCEKPIPRDKRCKASEVAGIPGLWADIDILDLKAHSKPNLPLSIEDAEQLARSVAEPSYIVFSGHGIQAWWLFREPWVFDSGAEREQAARLAELWQSALRAEAGRSGWDIDATHDLARVMRLPGTVNAKIPDSPVVVRTLHSTDARYNPSELEALCADVIPAAAKPAPKPARTRAAAGFVVTANPAPPAKLEVFRENSKKFDQSLRRKRKDFQDHSASSYDMSIATMMCAAEFSDQEIVDTLQWTHRVHGDSPTKHDWADYYSRTLAKAHENADRQSLDDERVKDMSREEMLAELERCVGVRIERIMRYNAAEAEYAVQTDTVTFNVGDVSGLIDKPKFRKKLADATRKLLPVIKGSQWDTVAGIMLALCEDESIGTQATRSGFITEMLEEYLAKEFEPVGQDGLEDAINAKRGFTKDDNIYLFGITVRNWIKQQFGDSLTAKEFGLCMRSIGAEPKIIRISEKTHHVWQVPPDFRGFVSQC